jgi:hypothetical protein
VPGHRKLVPDDFEVPERVEGGDFVVVPLERSLLALDYEAYMSSIAHLRDTYSADDPERWPEGVTPDLAFVDLAWCEYERAHRSTFAYAVLDSAETRERGCVYVFPCHKQGYDAECRCWVRESELADGFDSALEDWFRGWIETAWPFDPERVAWPGRGIDWDAWAALP